jgi:hypothetical protein
MTDQVTRERLGAWLVRCNPDIWDIVQYVDDGNDWVDHWTVQDNYRSDLMRIGDPVVLWVAAGPRRRASPGIWGVGHVMSAARGSLVDDSTTGQDEVGSPGRDRADLDYWLDPTVAARADYGVDVGIPILDDPLPSVAIASDSVLSALEVLRQPQMGNPSWLTGEQWHRLQEMLPNDYWEPMTLDDIERWQSADTDSAMDAETRFAMASRSMTSVMVDLHDQGWWVSEEVPETSQPWDVTAERQGVVRRIRVVGTTRHTPDVQLLPWERSAADAVPYWELAVVTRCLAKPRIHYFTASTVLAATRPALFTASAALRAVRQSWLTGTGRLRLRQHR